MSYSESGNGTNFTMPVAPMYGGNGGFGGNGFLGGDGAWWLIILLLFANNGWGNGFGFGGGGMMPWMMSQQNTGSEVQRGFDNQNSMANEREILASINSNALQGMQNANQNTQYVTGMLNDKYNELQRDIAGVAMQQQQAMAQQSQCCCETKMLVSETAANQRYESAMQNNAVLQAIQAEGNATRQLIQQDKIDGLQQKVQTLEMQNAMAGVVRYPMSTAYNAGFNPFCNCGNGGCCM